MSSNTIKKNLAYNISYQVLILLIPLVTTPYLSRIIGAKGIGDYSFYNSIASYFVLFAMLGLNNYGNRTIASIKNDSEKLSKTFSEIYMMQIVTGICAVVLYFIYCIVSGFSIISLVFLVLVFSSLFDVNWLFFGLEEFKLTVTRNTIIKVLTLVSIFIFVKDSQDSIMYCLIMAVGTLCSSLALLPFLPKYVKFIRPKWNSVVKHFKPNLVLFIPIVAISLYKTLDKIMIGALSSTIEVGYYENVERIILVPISIVQALGTVMLPRMSSLYSENEGQKGTHYIYLSILFVVFLTSAMSFGLMGVSHEFVPVFYGSGFEKCIKLFLLLSPCTVFMAIANVLRTQYLIPLKKDKIYIVSVFIGAISNVIFNSILIPFYGSSGAAFSTLVAEAFVCIYQFYKVNNEIDLIKPLKRSSLFIVSGLLMFIPLYFLDFNLQSVSLLLLIKIIIGVFLYIIIVGAILVVRRKLFHYESLRFE